MSGLFETVSLPALAAVALEDILAGLRGHRWPFGVELDFQNAVAAWLEHEGVNVKREYDLGLLGTIDFYFPSLRVGLELKVKGNATEVTRQLLRYAQSTRIDALILLSGRARHARVANTLNRKPVHVITTWAGGL